ncbi:UDP-N-acetylmuramoyl-L-alanyl-D-glutamate--2,6-diaminopimelate ligase [Extensimonas vulgaris]|uniref:UDP-N-acetylmuramoyl-L-alanyl-D-glutamate--2,6-diaminopimelate ligase n=1 Tax=Extensimonas vulgaris TaxID=1031594 RepID=A0A369AN13_9BURK|nr:UDP-N-acetylmuramoyl-L-alanyl-D-glutamate--2,6-diaminopimelate ligase [Extensimonas vulgaris]RCX10769.1 UDP-N-acetylmuramoylalanyl-D-glutamate--2,6-diaminopimelate ligase [Extensimonas vulgaris]TWI41411.1 UDP-N-acetylmuramoylalanyl-D-glutamate--2,6-diaminopimelate ligase [Extensimonas vulgaris]TXD16875.1 UDP-N-acetylmuramoyl-L-alanyl-D-glutamate--2,6-diaminopimelate ligase [Extensimonas vulgaris]
MRILQSASEAVQWLRTLLAPGRGTLQTDSRQIAPGDAFIAWPGAATDGRAHVADALARGAAACLVEQEGVEAFALDARHPDAAIAALRGLKAATGEIAAQWFGHPSAELDVIAITGTNGKTSTAWWLAHALSKKELHGHTGCGLIGTLGIGTPGQLEGSGLTTPDPVRLQRALRQMADQGLAACAIEASSIGLAEQRLAGTRIRVAVFTNFTQDHLDYHGDMDAYWRAKRALFDWPGLQAAVIHLDDAQGARLHAELEGAALDLWGVSVPLAQQPPAAGARLWAQDLHFGAQGIACTVCEGTARHPWQPRVVGRYNLQNLLGVLAVLRSLGVPLPEALRVCAALPPVPGRMQQVPGSGAEHGQPLVVVDYAHTPDALEQVLLALRPVAQARGGQLWCVFGCGGERDAGKRPQMGAVAQHRADWVVVTSDNPRGEDPAAIIHQILLGTIAGETVRAEPDRAAAIALALAEADAADVVLIAGKGHEDYQEIAGRRVPFSDLAQAQAALAARGGSA